MKAPLVLAVPTFNCERYLPATLRSLNAQGDLVQWWLQDGASSDRTVEIARSFARSGDVIRSEPDAGQSDALNRAMRQMGGEIIGFINGDDCLLPETAATVLQYFDSHPEVDLLYGRVEWIDESGVVTGHHSGSIKSLEEILNIYGVWWNERQWVQPEVFYRRSLWERVGGFDTQYDLAFDYDFWVSCFLAGAKVGHLPHTFTQFRKHAAQKSSAAKRAADEIRTIVGRHLPTARSIAPETRRRLQAELSYDQYQSHTINLNGLARPPFIRALLQNPGWLLCPPVRSRLYSSLLGRVRAKNSA